MKKLGNFEEKEIGMGRLGGSRGKGVKDGGVGVDLEGR